MPSIYAAQMPFFHPPFAERLQRIHNWWHFLSAYTIRGGNWHFTGGLWRKNFWFYSFQTNALTIRGKNGTFTPPFCRILTKNSQTPGIFEHPHYTRQKPGFDKPLFCNFTKIFRRQKETPGWAYCQVGCFLIW